MQFLFMPSWIAGLLLIAATIAIHAAGLVWIVVALRVIRRRLIALNTSAAAQPWLAIVLVGAVGAALATLHAIEAAIWAIAYLMLDAIHSLPAAMLYSIDSMTTRGDSGLILTEEWQLLGALEAANGVLLFGLSTAFLFGVVTQIWSMLPDEEAPG